MVPKTAHLMEDTRTFHEPKPTLYFAINLHHLLETDLFTFAHFPEKSRACESGSLDHISIPSTVISIKWRLPGLVADQVAQIFADSRPNVSTPNFRSVCESDQQSGHFHGIVVESFMHFER